MKTAESSAVLGCSAMKTRAETGFNLLMIKFVEGWGTWGGWALIIICEFNGQFWNFRAEWHVSKKPPTAYGSQMFKHPRQGKRNYLFTGCASSEFISFIHKVKRSRGTHSQAYVPLKIAFEIHSKAVSYLWLDTKKDVCCVTYVYKTNKYRCINSCNCDTSRWSEIILLFNKRK